MNITIKNAYDIDKKLFPHVLACVGSILRQDIELHDDTEKNIGVIKKGLLVANIKILLNQKECLVSLQEVS